MTYEEFEKEVARAVEEAEKTTPFVKSRNWGQNDTKNWARVYYTYDLARMLKIIEGEKYSDTWRLNLTKKITEIRWEHILNSKLYKLLNEAHDGLV